MLKYRTTIPLDQMSALRQEVDEIWGRFVVDVDSGKYQTAVISANEPPTGTIVIQSEFYNFAFEKIQNSWRTLESKDLQKTGLTQVFMKEFMDRLDWAYEHRNPSGLLLYLANDWKLSIKDMSKSKPSNLVADRATFAANENALMGTVTSYRHTREILSIAITQDRRTATVISRESTTMTVKGRSVSGVEQSIDTFELLDKVVLWKKSESAIEAETSSK